MMEVKTRVSSETHKCGGLNYIRKEIYDHQIKCYRDQVSTLSSELSALKSARSSELRTKSSEISALKTSHSSELKTKNSEISALKSEIYEMKAKQLQLEDFVTLADKLFYDETDEKEFADVKIVCDGRHFYCHKVVLGSQSDIFKTMFKNKSLSEEQSEGVMIIEENDFDCDIMEQLLRYFYFQKVEEGDVINADLMVAADKYNVKGLLNFCTKYLESNLHLDEDYALDILVKAELIGQKNLFDAASKYICKNMGRVNKSSDWVEMSKKNPALIVKLFSQMSVME